MAQFQSHGPVNANVPGRGVIRPIGVDQWQGSIRRSIGFGHILLVVAATVMLLIGLANSSAAQSGQAHVIDGQQVFCETLMQNDALVVRCVSGSVLHLEIQQVGDRFLAFPRTAFGKRINAVAYGYREGKSAG